jgi:hypothetical protein
MRQSGASGNRKSLLRRQGPSKNGNGNDGNGSATRNGWRRAGAQRAHSAAKRSGVSEMADVRRVVGEPGVGCTGTKVTAINNLGTSAMVLVGANPLRQFIRFANPGTVTAYVAMERDGNGNALMPCLLALGGCFPVVGGAQLTVSGECQLGWNGLAASGTNNPLTVFESNID